MVEEAEAGEVGADDPVVAAEVGVELDVVVPVASVVVDAAPAGDGAVVAGASVSASPPQATASRRVRVDARITNRIVYRRIIFGLSSPI